VTGREVRQETDGREVVAAARERGEAYERSFGGCAQCTIAAVQDVLSGKGILDWDTAVFQAASGLAGGMGRGGDGTCGAFTGAAMAIGSACGRIRSQFADRGSTDRSLDAVYEFRARFREAYGSCTCRDVQERLYGRSFDLRDSGDRAELAKSPALCPTVVGSAAAWATEILLKLRSAPVAGSARSEADCGCHTTPVRPGGE